MPVPQITVEGRVVADPELRFAASGVAVARVRVVASSRKKEGDEWVDDKTFWINVTAFKKLAENVAESITKGDEVVVVGRIHTEEWETDGQKRTAPVILADSIGPSLRMKAAKPVEMGGSSGSTASSSAQADEPPF